MIIGTILVIVFLSVLILVHELGHFLAAKKFGLLVEEFGIGLPPRIWGKKIGETIYSVNWLPFGGFVKIFGENREEEGENPEISESKETILIETKEEISVSESSVEIEKEILIVESENFPGKRNFSSLPAWKRAIILFAGVFMNFLLGWFVVSIVFFTGVPESVLITDVASGSPAAEAGILPGDSILNFSKVEDFQSLVASNQGKEISVTIDRQGEKMDFSIKPRIETPDGEGPIGVILIQAGLPEEGFWKSISGGLKFSAETVGMIFQFLFDLLRKVFIGQADLSQVAGPIGIVKITYQAGNMGFVYVLQLLALISLNLVVLNILPFPALDGGRILFLLIEKIKGSPLPLKFEKYANALGMALLLILMIAITVKDINGLI
jgi:regulator of sigma E protease